jgi:selenocysteine-specific elongation factor
MAKAPTLIMGTAGHVDHGKTTLVKALTGVDLDTLPEEKERGLTISLGFTSFDTPSGHRIGVVDVPGHRRFVKTMLAGAHGLDFVLFLVAADDSVMPQTREHLQILRLLGVERGIIALTKIDLVEEDLREMVKEEVRELVAGTFLEDAPLIPVSSMTGQGMQELIEAVDGLSADVRPRERGAYFRLFVDRAFTVAGAGTVITGTALAGSVSPGDELEILPKGGRARVRKIEVHGESVERARAGQRTAVNLRLTDKASVSRGDMLAAPGKITSTYMVDARLEVLDSYPRAVAHWTRVRFYLGTLEAFGRVVLLDTEQVAPGDSAYVQIRLESPIPAVAGDPFIARDFSSSWTIGGGRILDAHPTKHKRKRSLVVSDLERREKGYLEEVVELEAKKAGYFVARNQIATALDAPADRLGQAASALSGEGKIIILPPKKSPWVIHQEAWDRLVSRILEILKEHHASLPQLETGLSEQELRERISRSAGAELPEEPFRHALQRLVDEKAIKQVEATYALSEHFASLGEDDQAALAKIRAAYSENPLAPPATDELYENSGLPRQVVRGFLDKLLKEGDLLRVSREFLFEARSIDAARDKVIEFIKNNGQMTVAQFRDLVGTTRKYAIPILNFFDNQGYTERDGDYRRLGPGTDGC